MLHTIFSNKFTHALAAVAAGAALSGCHLVTEELPECPALLKVRFVYDYTLTPGDAFASEVKSVNVWAFNADGQFVWAGAASGDELKNPEFALETPLREGSYDFVAWCGLEGNTDFAVGTYEPASKQELDMKLNTVAESDLNVSKHRFSGLYHGTASGQQFTIDPNTPSFKTVTIPLMKDTKDIHIMLQHIDGSPIDNRDFETTITYADSWYDWNNNIVPGCPTVTYRPWNVVYGQTTPPGEQTQARDNNTVASLLFELSSARLMADGNAILNIRRKWDNRDVIRISLIEYFLMVRGHYKEQYTDQQFLDRCDYYTAIFFIDQHSTWYKAGGVYINGWAVVPPQHEEF